MKLDEEIVEQHIVVVAPARELGVRVCAFAFSQRLFLNWLLTFLLTVTEKKLADSRKRAKILADNRKCHHPIETLYSV